MATDPITERKEHFDQAFSEVDEKQLAKSVDFAQHRFVSIERDKLTSHRYVKGHKSLRGACNHLARAQMEGESYVPEHILDMDTGELHELELMVHVAPKHVGAVSIMLPAALAEGVLSMIKASASETARTAEKLFQQAIDRSQR